MKRLLLFAPLVLFVALVGALFLGLRGNPAVLPSTLINRPMPEFSLAPVRASDARFTNADLEGQVVLVNVFASWCTPCRLEHPTLLALSRAGRVPIHGINWKEPPQDGLAYLAAAGDPYVRIGSDENGRFALDLGVTGAPETFIVDRRGRIRYKQVGPITPAVWRAVIEPILVQLESEP